MIHLHLHSQYSIRDAISSIPDIVKRIKEIKAPAFAITDHGNVFAYGEASKYASEAGIKYIVGVEAYVRADKYEKHTIDELLLPPGKRRYNKKTLLPVDLWGRAYYHLVLLVINETGFKNLSTLLKIGGRHAKKRGSMVIPIIDHHDLQQYNEGLIGLAACVVGEINYHLAIDNDEHAEEILKKYLNIFGDRFYLEIMYHHLPEEEKIIPKIIKLSHKYNVPLVVTNDAHYVAPEDAQYHAIIADYAAKEDSVYTSPDYYITSSDDLIKRFAQLDIDKKQVIKWIDNTYLVAERISFTPVKYEHPLLPKLYSNGPEILEKQVYQRAYEIYGNPLPEHVQKRIQYELSIIQKQGFADYFLLVSDYVKEARRRGISVGPGRGSAVGSIVSFLTEITEVDPLKYDLLFERFLSPDRVSLPDIDVDFDAEKREEVVEYIVNKYGADYVAHIGTFINTGPKNALKDVISVFTNKQIIDADTKKILFKRLAEVMKTNNETILAHFDTPLEEIEDYKLRLDLENINNLLREKIIDKQTLKQLITYAARKEKLPRGIGKHASGYIISSVPLYTVAPLLYTSPTDKLPTIALTMEYSEAIGLVKVDLLGLKNLTDIARTIEYIHEYTGFPKEQIYQQIATILKNPNDPAVFAKFSNGEVAGIFQFSSPGMKKYLKKLKPSHIEDLIAMTALYRPGPLGSGAVDKFIFNKHFNIIKPNIPIDDPALKETLSQLLRNTYGIIVYQEQIMQISRVIAGFSPSEADLLRKAVAKKKEKLMQELKNKFIKGGIAKGYKEKDLLELWQAIEFFGQYGFNKSHATAYALISYVEMALKTYYPLQFYASLLTASIKDPIEITNITNELRKAGYKVTPPDIRYSEYNRFVISKDDPYTLRAPFMFIVGLSKDTVLYQEEFKKAGTDIEKVKEIAAKLSDSILYKLVNAGAFDYLNLNSRCITYLTLSPNALKQQLKPYYKPAVRRIQNIIKYLKKQQYMQQSMFGQQDMYERITKTIVKLEKDLKHPSYDSAVGKLMLFYAQREGKRLETYSDTYAERISTKITLFKPNPHIVKAINFINSIDFGYINVYTPSNFPEERRDNEYYVLIGYIASYKKQGKKTEYLISDTQGVISLSSYINIHELTHSVAPEEIENILSKHVAITVYKGKYVKHITLVPPDKVREYIRKLTNKGETVYYTVPNVVSQNNNKQEFIQNKDTQNKDTKEKQQIIEHTFSKQLVQKIANSNSNNKQKYHQEPVAKKHTMQEEETDISPQEQKDILVQQIIRKLYS